MQRIFESIFPGGHSTSTKIKTILVLPWKDLSGEVITCVYWANIGLWEMVSEMLCFSYD